jgi:hypothetical protein
MSKQTDPTSEQTETTAPKKGKSKKNDEQPERVKRVTFQRQLSCALSRDQLLNKGSEQAAMLSQRDGIEAALKAAQKAGKAQIDEVEAAMRRVAGEIRDRAELRLVGCVRAHDWERGTVTEYRDDTGEEIASRRMSDDEKQREMDFGDGDVDSEFGE